MVIREDSLPPAGAPPRWGIPALRLSVLAATLLYLAGCGTKPELGELITNPDELPGAAQPITLNSAENAADKSKEAPQKDAAGDEAASQAETSTVETSTAEPSTGKAQSPDAPEEP